MIFVDCFYHIWSMLLKTEHAQGLGKANIVR